MFVHYLVLLAQIGWAALGGYEPYQVAKLKEEWRTKYASVLKHSLDGRMIEIEALPQPVALSEVRLRHAVVRVPAFSTKPELRNDEESATIKYENYWVMLSVMEPGKDELPPLLGGTNFDRFRAVYALDQATLDRARSTDDLAVFAIRATAKGLMVSTLAEQRFTEFRSPRWKGFVLGGFAAGAPAAEFQCFALDRKTTPQQLTVTFIKLKPESAVTDAEVERYLAAIETDDVR